MTQLTLDFEKQAKRLSPQQSRVLNRLRKGPATSVDLNAICLRYGGRIYELRRKGYSIGVKRLGQGVWQYWIETNRDGKR